MQGFDDRGRVLKRNNAQLKFETRKCISGTDESAESAVARMSDTLQQWRHAIEAGTINAAHATQPH